MRMFQLYVRGDDAFVEDYVSRAVENRYTAFCITVDTAHYSRRERDIAKRYVRESRLRATGGEHQKGLSWRTVKLVKDKFINISSYDDAVHQVDLAKVDLSASRGTLEQANAQLRRHASTLCNFSYGGTLKTKFADGIKGCLQEVASADFRAFMIDLYPWPLACDCFR